MTKIITSLLTSIFILSSVISSNAGRLDDLKNLRNKNAQALENLKASGLGHAHPKIKQLQNTLAKLDLDIENTKELQQEIVVLIEGTKSKYLEGHTRHGKTDKALTELLNAGWKIEKIIPAGTTKEMPKNQQEANLLKAAYVWLSHEG